MKNDKIKPSYDTNRQILGHILPLDTPFNVIFDSSEACNFCCNYCFRSSADKSKWGYAADSRLMKWEVFERAFQQAMGFPEEVRQISLSNHGEPLCNRGVPRMARYMRDQGYRGRISLHTNGSLIDDVYAEELATAGISRIVISLQGMSARKYKEICDYRIERDEMIQKVHLLYEARERIGGDLQIHVKVADVALEDGEEEEFYACFLPIADRVFVEHIVPIWKDVKVGEAGENKFGEAFPPQKCCPLIFHTIVVTPSGDVYPCTQLLNEYKLGNINQCSLLEYWNSDERRHLLRSILTLNAPNMCKGCYILQNSIYTKEDMIDYYRNDILDRMRGRG